MEKRVCQDITHRRRVTIYKGNYSAFNGYRFTPSDYSECICIDCRLRWRTKAKYVKHLSAPTQEELAEYDRGIGVHT